MELRQLEALRTIVDTGNFAIAAERLRLTQPALSHQIKNLEDELGVTLLIRARPRVYPTDEGTFVLAAAERIFAGVGEIRERFPRKVTERYVSTLRIASTNVGFVYIYGDLCQAFIERNPRIELIFRATETPDEAVRRVLDGSADVAFGPLPQYHAQLTTVSLGTANHAFIVGPTHPLADTEAEMVTLDQVKEWPFVRFLPNSGSREVSDRVFMSSGGYPQIMTESNDAEYIKRVVGLGSSVALVPTFAIHREIETQQVKLLNVECDLPNVEFGICHRSNVERKSIEMLKALGVEMRGLLPRRAATPGLGQTSPKRTATS